MSEQLDLFSCEPVKPPERLEEKPKRPKWTPTPKPPPPPPSAKYDTSKRKKGRVYILKDRKRK